MCRRHAFQLSVFCSSMRSEQLASLVMGTPAGIRLACRRVADIERSVGPDRVHDHRQLARNGDTGLTVTGAFGDRLAPSY